MAKAPTYFKERKEFLLKMIPDMKKGAWAREMKHTKTLFEKYPIEFITVVGRPPFQLNSLAYLTNGDGEKFLNLKLIHFNYKETRIEAKVQDKKVGEDYNIKSIPSIRNFLLNE